MITTISNSISPLNSSLPPNFLIVRSQAGGGRGGANSLSLLRFYPRTDWTPLGPSLLLPALDCCSLLPSLHHFRLHIILIFSALVKKSHPKIGLRLLRLFIIKALFSSLNNKDEMGYKNRFCVDVAFLRFFVKKQYKKRDQMLNFQIFFLHLFLQL